MKARPLFVTLTVAGSLISGVARAGDAAAEALYEEGRQAAQAHDYALACRKFKASQDREPAPGTLLNLADCEENRGKLVDARAYFDAASRLFHAGDDRIAYAKQRAAALDRRIPTLTLRLDPTAPTETTVERDSVVLDRGALGAPTPTNPGEHVLLVRAPGRADMRTTIRLAEGEKREIDLSVGEPAASAPGPTKGAAVSPAPPPPPAPAAPEVTKVPETIGVMATSDGGSSLRTGAVAAFGVGVIGLGFGIAGGLITLSAKNTVDNPLNCTPQYCNGAGQSAESRGKTWGAISTAGFIAAGVGAGAGFALLLVMPGHTSTVGSAGAFSIGAVPGGGSVGWTSAF